ncbi:hypothetical protein LguiA_034925 [Lonicera macranthoides]
MAGMYSGLGGETETSAPVEPSSRSARRRRMEVHQFNIVPTDMALNPTENGRKRPRIEAVFAPVHSCGVMTKSGESNTESLHSCGCVSLAANIESEVVQEVPKFGLTSVCGRRRDMEDAVAVHPSFCSTDRQKSSDVHFYGVYDGHGCSHVAMKCKDRMHEIVKEELENGEERCRWNDAMKQSFSRMDEEITEWSNNAGVSNSNCRCELQTPQCDAVGSTAVVAVVTPEKLIVSNCGDSRAVLCRKGVAIPLSSDHKPDRPDELQRIEEAGGRVIYWDGARVLGVLAMSRAIGDNYLKPYVIPEPEVTVTDRTVEDEFLILASDGLWDVVSNETACGVAMMCLRGQKPPSPPRSPGGNDGSMAAGECSDKACSDASILLTKLALARHSADNVSVVVVDLKKIL